MKRVCGLTRDAQRHLQWALSLFFGRNPREDTEWQADEDLPYRAAWLKQMVETGFKDAYGDELAEVEVRLQKLQQKAG